MRRDWKKVKIDDICTVGDGAHASIKRTKTGIKYLTSKNFSLTGLNLSKIDYISETDYEKYFNPNSKALTKPKIDDVLLSIIGSMGAPYLVNNHDKFGLSSSVSILRPKKQIIYSKFLFYWIKTEYFQKSIDSIKSGVAQSFLSLAMIRSLPCFLPPLKTQRKIANILSAYDDLIENNRRRIALLEEQAQLTYEDWFVRMRFPGFEEVEVVEGLPKGWEKVKLKEVVKISSSKRIFLSDYVEKGIPFYRSKEIILKSKNIQLSDRLYISNDKFNNIKKKYGSPQKGDILITAVGSLGFPYLVTETDSDFYFKDGNLIWLKNIKKISSEYLISIFNNPYFKSLLNNIAIGSSQKALTIKSLKEIEILKPSSEILTVFDSKIISMLNSVENLQTQNRLLQEARDILLPRLMLGIVDMEEI